MATLTIALEMRVKVTVTRTIRIGAVGPLRISALDRKSSHPLSERIFDGQRIRDVVASRAHFRMDEHLLPVSLVFRDVHVLIRNVLAKDLTGVRILVLGWLTGCQRAESFWKNNRMRRQAVRTSADAVSQVLLVGVGRLKRLLLRGSQQFRACLFAGNRRVLPIASRIVVERSVACLGIGVAYRADDSALARFRVTELCIQRRVS